MTRLLSLTGLNVAEALGHTYTLEELEVVDYNNPNWNIFLQFKGDVHLILTAPTKEEFQAWQDLLEKYLPSLHRVTASR